MISMTGPRKEDSDSSEISSKESEQAVQFQAMEDMIWTDLQRMDVISYLLSSLPLKSGSLVQLQRKRDTLRLSATESLLLQVLIQQNMVRQLFSIQA